jgi:hypothetical protein
MSKLKIAVIIGSTRDARVGPKPAQWIFDLAKQREELDVELVDLKDFNPPLFNEVATNFWAPSQDPKALAWQKKVGELLGTTLFSQRYDCWHERKVQMLKNTLAVSAALWLLASPTAAQSPLAKAVMQGCKPDIKQFCSDVAPGGGRVKACMKAHLAELSEPCKEAIFEGKMNKY